ncbi:MULTISPECIES: autotransporter domain-containing protein [unclassified Yoonia]|uniref:autotransporter domain-containing protein n=1 Tax=unclassified Yoonia TaxID=2629118 RepID=UPI002AFDDAB1|nr:MULTISPECIES: autotransporter domain-containing protein [unclassified Yoonia]
MTRPDSPYSNLRKGGYALLLSTTIAIPLLQAAPVQAQDSSDTLRLLTYNIWNRYKQSPQYAADAIAAGNYDVVMFQEENGSRYVADIPAMLADRGLGTYQGARNGSSGTISRLPGTMGTHTLPAPGAQGRSISYVRADAADGRPETVIGSVHFNYFDEPDTRINEAKGLSAWARSINGPLIMGGDFNAGDVSERGLHSVSQQELLLRIHTKSSNSFYYDLLSQYATDKAALDQFIADWRGSGNTAIDNAPIPAGLFEEELYPIAGNTPVTMNILKKQFMLMQTEAVREAFVPHERGNGSATWPSNLEDATNTWGSWHRARIDHLMVSRPYGKWFTLVDDPNDPYLGVIDGLEGGPEDNRRPLTDHDLVAHEFRWVGPQLETYDSDATRLIWGEGASTFAEDDKVFYLTRNNMRTDVYLGQIADENGNPVLTGLTLDEKKTLLDCTSSDPRFQAAIVEYCIDDHIFIDETLVMDGGTLIVDEDAALGGSAAQLRLADGGLRIAGTAMTALDRDVSLEGIGGFIDIADGAASVDASGVFAGTGSLTKHGAGGLTLSGDNSYSGATMVSGGVLTVDGSIASSNLTTVQQNAVLGGSGTVGNLTIASGGTLGAGNSIGTLSVAGDLTFADGARFEVETDSQGNADRVDVTGRANLSGSVFALTAAGEYKPSTSYTILTAGDGIIGTFGSVTSTLAFLDAGLAYGVQDVSLRLDRNDTAFDSVASTGNRRAVAAAVETLGMGHAVYDAVVMTDADTADTTFDGLSGEAHASAAAALTETALAMGNVVAERSRAMAGGAIDVAQGPAVGAMGAGQVWFQTFGNWGESSGDGVTDIKRDSNGTLIGFDTDIGNNWHAGGFVGFGNGSLRRDGGDRLDADSVHAGVYAGTTSGPLGLSLGLTQSRNDVNSLRSTTFGGTTETLTAAYDSDTTQIFGEARYRFDTAQGALEPFGAIAHVRQSNDAFTEKGGAAALTSAGSDVDTTFTTLGLRTEQLFAMGQTDATFRGELGWRHAFGDVDPGIAMGFADGGTGFDVLGAPVAEDSAVLRASVGFDLAPGAQLAVGYAGQFSDDTADHGLTADLRIRF